MRFNNQTLRTAVKDWLSDFASAEIQYGHISKWDTSLVTDMSKLFEKAYKFNEPLSNWDVGNVNDMNGMFIYAFQ